MTRSIFIAGVAVLVPFIAFSQSAALPAFEVASIRPSVSGLSAPIETGPKTFTARGMSASVLIQWAYSLRDFQVAGVPDWVKSERYDVEAKSQESSSESEMRRMLQALLAERFHLRFHRETQELPGYALTIAKSGPRLELAKDAAKPGNIQIGRGGILYGRAAPMLTLAGALTILIGGPVLDRTGLDGNYDFKLEYDPGSVNGRESGERSPDSRIPKASIYTALQEQLGLRLESSKEPLEVLVIDSIERPSEN